MPINAPYGFAFVVGAVSDTALTLVTFGFTQANVDLADRVFVTVRSQPIRYTFDGTTPTDTVGHYKESNASFELIGSRNIANLQFIRATGSDSELSITLERF